MKATRTPQRVIDRATSKFTVDPSTGCHISEYSIGSHGYPQIGWWDSSLGKSHMVLVHRVAWEAKFGPIEDGMTVDHMCKQRRCCNVEHLRLLSNYENARRTMGRDWPIGRCVAGHPNSESYVQPNGRRLCHPCNRAAQARYQAKKAAS